MKRLLNLFVVTILALTAVTFTGCSKDDEEFTVHGKEWTNSESGTIYKLNVEENINKEIIPYRLTFLADGSFVLTWHGGYWDENGTFVEKDGMAEGKFVAQAGDRSVYLKDKNDNVIGEMRWNKGDKSQYSIGGGVRYKGTEVRFYYGYKSF